MTRHLTSCLLALTVLLPAAPAAHAQSEEGFHKRAVLRLLMSRRGFPTRRHFLRTGKIVDTNRIIALIASDRKVKHYMRLNALRALEYFPSKRSEEVLMTTLYARKQMPAYQRVCLRALARGFGVRMYYEILPFLRHEHPKVRAGAALALGEIDDGRVQGILMTHLANEQSISVRLAIEAALEAIKRRNQARLQPRIPKGAPLPKK